MGVKWRKVIALLLAFVVVVTTAATGIPLTVKAAETSTGFVKRDGTKFTLDGSDFYYAGTNNYYINFKPSEDVDEVMKDAEDMGLTVIRTWGHLDVGTITDQVDTSDNCPVFERSVDGKGQKEGVYYQYWDAEKEQPVVNHGENGLQKLDYVIYQAEKHNIKILPTLTNYWEPFGGMAQYCVWAGLTKSDVEQFYSNETIKGWFKNYINEVLNHKNVYTGRYLKDEPAILAWELANEPRYNAQDKSIENNAMYQWASEMSAYIKEIDENHMVSVGDEGGMYYNEYVSDHPGSNAVPEGEAVKTGGHIWHGGMGNFHHLMQIETIDFATPHLYPGVWQMSSQAELESWLKLHAEVAHDANKPVVLEEFGWSNKETAEDVTEYAAGRDNFFKYIYNAMEEYDYAGSNFWMLGSHTLNDACGYYPDYDGFTVYNFENALSNDGNGQYTVDLYGTNSIIKEHAETMNNKGNKNKVSESTITYDKADPSACEVTVTPQEGAEVESISVDGNTVSEGDVYSLSDNTLTFKQTYLDGLEDSTYYVTITMSEGRNLQLKVVVMDSSITSAVAGDGPFTFDKNVKVAKDVTIPVIANDGGNCKGVSVLESDNTKTALSSDAYSVTDSGVTISANYLLGMEEGKLTVILDYTNGTDPIVTITISDTTGKDVIDDFESYESDSALSAAWAVNTSGGTVTPTLVTGQSDSKAMKYDFSYSNGYAGITKSAGSLPVTDFDGISFWIKAEETTDNDLTIQLSEPAGDYSSIYWEKTYTWADMKAANGTTIKIPFSEFAAKSGYTQPADGQVCGDNGVSEFSIYVGGNTQTNSFYIDDIQLYSEGGSDITNVDVESVTLSKDTLTIEEGKSEQLTATVLPDTATFKTVNWASEDTSVATVVNGKVTGVGEGTTTITCTSAVDSSKKATCTVTVTKASETPATTTEDSATTTAGTPATTEATVSGDIIGTLAWGDVAFSSSSDWDEVKNEDDTTKEFSVKAASTAVPEAGSTIKANIYLPGTTAPSYAGEIKFCGVMRLGDDWHWVESLTIPAVEASDFTKVSGKNCYKATIEIPFEETVKAYYDDFSGDDYNFADVVTENVSALTLKCAGSNSDFTGDIYVGSVQLLDAEGEVICAGGSDEASGETGGESGGETGGETGGEITGGTLIDDFSKNTVGKETQGYLWYTNPGYQYNNGSGTSGSAEPAISWNSEKECMDIALDYSADSDKSWSEAKIALWKSPGYDISEYNCLSLQYTYPENLKDVAVKVYASNPAQSESEKVVLMDSNMERTNEVDNGDGTYTATMILYFTPTSEVTLGSINIGFVGKYSDQTGTISIDDVRVSSQKIAGAIEVPEVGTATTVDLDKMPSEVKMADGNVNAKTAAAYAYLMGTVEDGKVLFGHQNDNSRRVAAEVSDTKDMVGSYSAVVAYDSLAITGSELGVSTSEGLAQTVSASKDAIANGAIISLSLHMPNFATMAKEGSTDFSKYDFDSSKDLNNNCAESILPGKANNALYNQYLDIIADYANQLDGEPILFRPLHENSGGWFWWGSSTNVETYKALWRYTVDYLTETKGVHNLIFVYSPNGPITSEAQYLERYPGDEYVDVFGFDYYNDYGQGATYNTSFEEGLNTSCSVINGLAEARGKVAVIAETGVRVTKADGTNEGLLVSGNPINDKDWYNMVNNVAAKNGIAYFLLWANFSNQNFYVPYKFDETTGQELSDDFVDFYNNETSVFADGTNYQDAKAKTVTAAGYTEPAGYMIAPVDFAEYPTATTFTASVKRAEKVTFEIKRNAEDTEPVVVTAEKNTAGIYEAQITDAVLAEVGEVDVAIVTLKGDDTVIASAKYISLGKEKDKMPAGMVDNFDYYYGDQSYLASQYCGSNSAAGCGSSMSITKSNAKDGTYAGKYTYQLSYAGSEGYTGTGRILSVNDYSKTPDGNDTNALSMWVKPDGNGQKLVVQFVSDGYEFEAYLTEFMKGTEAQYVTIPFSAMKPKVSGKVFNPANVTQMYFYCNTMPDNAPVADKTNFSFESAIYFDKIMAIAADEDKLAEAGTQGYVVSDTMLDGSVDEERPEVSVTGVTLDPSEVTLEAGKTLTLNVSVEPEDATNTDVTWSSSDETVATVINGVVTAVAEGNATITVTTVDGEMTATCEVTVTATSEDDATTEETDATTEETEVTTAGVPSSEDLATTEGTDVTTEETDATTAGAPSSEDMATTEGTDVTTEETDVTTAGAPSSEDMATTEGTSSSEDDATTEGTSSSEDDATTEGTSSSEDDATTEGTSSSEGDATTEQNPSSEDSTTTQGNPSTEEPAKVPVDSVELNKESVGMLVGDEITLTETVYPVDATNKAVTWRTGNSSIATVENGVVKAVSEGVTSIIVITEDGSFTAVCSVYVSSAEIPVTGVSFVKDSMVLVEGESEVLKVTIEPKDATNQKVEFESSDYNIANVDANGKVTAIGKGTAIITVTTADGAKQASILVEVQPKGEAAIPVQGITATDSNVNMVVGDAKQLTYTITPANATNQTVQWETNNSDVVTVTNGILKAVGTGTAKVRATTEDGSYVVIWNITVTAAEVAVEGVSVTETMISLEEGDTKQLEYSVLPADATNPKVKFESRDQNIVNIDATGNITAISAGTTTIDIITLDGGYRAVVMIEVTAKDSGSTNQPGGDNTTQQPGEDSTSQQPGGDNTSQQPGGDNTSQQPGGDSTSQQPGEDNTSQQPGEDNTSQQPGGDNTSQQPGEDNTSQQPGGDSTSQQPGGDSTAQQPGGDSTTQQSGGTNATTQQPAGSNSTTAQQPGGANATTAQPAGSTQTDSTAAKKVKKVTGLKKVKAGTKSIKLKWKKLSSVKGYKVYVYNAKTKKYKLYKTVKKTNVTVKKLTRNKTYKFKVRAYTKDGGSTIYGSYSKVLKVKTKK